MSGETGSARVTMKNVADALGVSRSSVSLALRGDPRVSAKLREQVKLKADEMGYRPDPALGILSQHRKQARGDRPRSKLALVTHRVLSAHSKPQRAGQVGWRSRNQVFIERAERRGFDLDVFFVEDYPSPRDLAQELREQGRSGVILSAVDPRLRWMDVDWRRFAVIQSGWGLVRMPFHMVGYNIPVQAKYLADRLIHGGCQRLGFIAPQPKLISTQEYYVPYAEAMTQMIIRDRCALYRLEHGNESGPEFIGSHIPEPWEKRELNLAWVKEHRIDGIIALNSAVILGLLDLGMQMPDQLQAVSLNVHPDGPVAGFKNVGADAAERTLEYLDQMVRLNEYGIPAIRSGIFLDRPWVEGETLRPEASPGSEF